MEFTGRQTPRGTRDCLPDRAAKQRAVEHLILTVLAAWGYREVITPTYEFYDALKVGGGWDWEQKMFKFFDREGQILALRPDLTTPIARVVATRLQDEPKPLRLAYNASVFRHEESQMWRYREFRQAGPNSSGPGARRDGEIVALAHAVLQECGLDPQVDIGHVDYCQGLLEETGLDPSSQRRLRSALMRRDYVLLRETLDERPVAGELKEHILTLPAFGAARKSYKLRTSATPAVSGPSGSWGNRRASSLLGHHRRDLDRSGAGQGFGVLHRDGL